ncbi:hypothetical protein MA16_Dca020922 [Dendrobium catenatum]|uniref:Uncharacterized protein n=1 Tax=Dendrobium catenatum TaxID=906689 RepID=A0A2I0VN75_9ASPA|nr:hypothetical protein MA16_Dca020922 [Dendrobium catenatum]
MLRVIDTDKSCLHLIYEINEMWDLMLAKVKKIIYRHERNTLHGNPSFWDIIYAIIEDR